MLLRRICATLLAAGAVYGLSPSSPGDIPDDTPLSSLLSQAQGHLSRGETNEALVYYDAAISRDPTNYVTFFKRATAYLGLGRSVQATNDFIKVLSLKPNFEAAHIHLGRIRQRAGDWDGALHHFSKVKATTEVQELSKSLEESRVAATLADAAEVAGNWETCVSQASIAIMVASRSIALRQQRAHCHLAMGEAQKGAADLLHVLQLNPGDVEPHLAISALHFYSLGDLERGISQVRRCLHSDPDSKPCRELLKQERAVEKILAKVEKAVSKSKPSTAVKSLVSSSEEPGLIQIVEDQIQKLRDNSILPPSLPNIIVTRLVELTCQAYFEMNSMKAKDWCENALALDTASLYGLLYKHKSQMDAELFDAAIDTLNQAKTSHPDKAGIIDPLISEAQMMHRRSKTKDYYKILDVPRDASKSQIKAAYRKLTKIHHPDKAAAKQSMTKEDAEKKMASINEAYEVLSNEELRARFDHGDDPMSTEQPYHTGHPFGFNTDGQQFVFQRSGQGQQQFKFRFGSNGFPFSN